MIVLFVALSEFLALLVWSYRRSTDALDTVRLHSQGRHGVSALGLTGTKALDPQIIPLKTENQPHDEDITISNYLTPLSFPTTQRSAETFVSDSIMSDNRP